MRFKDAQVWCTLRGCEESKGAAQTVLLMVQLWASVHNVFAALAKPLSYSSLYSWSSKYM